MEDHVRRCEKGQLFMVRAEWPDGAEERQPRTNIRPLLLIRDADDSFPGEQLTIVLQTIVVHGVPPC